MNQIKIGTFIRQPSQYIDIQSNHPNYDIVNYINLSNYKGVSNFIKGVQAVLSNEVNVAMLPLVDVPLHVKEHGVIIGALSQRSQPGYSLILKTNAVDITADLKIAADSKIAVPSILEKKQLISLNQWVQVTIEDLETYNTSNFLSQHQYDGLVLPIMLANEYDFNHADIIKIDLHPKEFIPKPGSGVMAFLVHPESFELRDFLKNIHHKETGELTNIERRSWLLAEKNNLNEFGAYCNKDSRNFFHISVCEANTDLRMRNLSLSTSSGLDELAISSLKN